MPKIYYEIFSGRGLGLETMQSDNRSYMNLKKEGKEIIREHGLLPGKDASAEVGLNTGGEAQ